MDLRGEAFVVFDLLELIEQREGFVLLSLVDLLFDSRIEDLAADNQIEDLALQAL